jgi:AcrR family transcriptional regulator
MGPVSGAEADIDGSAAVAGAGVRERRRASSRARVLDAALDLFAERGYDAVTVADVCGAAGIAPRTFFRYFPAKEDVLAQPVRALGERMSAELAAAPPGLSDADALDAAVLALGAVVVADRERLVRLFQVLRRASEDRVHPLVRLADEERALAADLARRHGDATPDWRTRLLVARHTATVRVWLDDLLEGTGGDPLEHLREIVAANR